LRDTQVKYQNLKAQVMTTDQQYAASEEADMVIERGPQDSFHPSSRILNAAYRSTRGLLESNRAVGLKPTDVSQGW
jgi:hypothetical protein